VVTYVSTATNSCFRLLRYHLKDVIVGKIYFLLVRIKIKHMELSIIRRETTGSPPNQYNESETITKFEIMDGAPVRGMDLSPSSPHIYVMNKTESMAQAKRSRSGCSLAGLT
jgi:Vacuolar protein sorting-associated protein 26